MFALVDCNNFYVSCERVFNASIARRPVIVLSNNDGCVIARSNETKAIGIVMGEPYFKVRERVRSHNIAVFSSNYTLYGDMSQRVMQALEQFAPELETYSIDEAFLGLSGIPEGEIACHAAQIRRTVKRWTGIPVSVGVGPTKTLAKAANHRAKKDPAAGGVWIIASEAERREALARLPVGDVWGIGRRWAALLESNGVTTALQLSELRDEWVRRHLNVVGLRTVTELRGTPCLPLELEPPPRKGLVVSRAFGKRLTELRPIREALAAYVTRAAEKLRRGGLQARQMTVFLHNSPFSDSEAYFGDARSFRLASPTSDTAELIRHACTALEQLFRPGYRYTKCGVMLSMDPNPYEVGEPELLRGRGSYGPAVSSRTVAGVQVSDRSFPRPVSTLPRSGFLQHRPGCQGAERDEYRRLSLPARDPLRDRGLLVPRIQTYYLTYSPPRPTAPPAPPHSSNRDPCRRLTNAPSGSPPGRAAGSSGPGCSARGTSAAAGPGSRP